MKWDFVSKPPWLLSLHLSACLPAWRGRLTVCLPRRRRPPRPRPRPQQPEHLTHTIHGNERTDGQPDGQWVTREGAEEVRGWGPGGEVLTRSVTRPRRPISSASSLLPHISAGRTGLLGLQRKQSGDSACASLLTCQRPRPPSPSFCFPPAQRDVRGLWRPWAPSSFVHPGHQQCAVHGVCGSLPPGPCPSAHRRQLLLHKILLPLPRPPATAPVSA